MGREEVRFPKIGNLSGTSVVGIENSVKCEEGERDHQRRAIHPYFGQADNGLTGCRNNDLRMQILPSRSQRIIFHEKFPVNSPTSAGTLMDDGIKCCDSGCLLRDGCGCVYEEVL